MLINMRNGLMAGKRLPYDAEVEYLESTGTQWIDTGVLATSSTEISIQFAVTSNVLQGIFGRRVSALNNSMLVLQYKNGDIWKIRWDRGSGAADMATPAMGHVYSGASNGRYFTLDSLTYDAGYLNGSGTSLYLFAVNQSGSPTFLASALQIYDCGITEGGVLVRDFIPVRFTNELGVSEGAMYDRVTKKFFRNKGTGAFSWGDDI